MAWRLNGKGFTDGVVGVWWGHSITPPTGGGAKRFGWALAEIAGAPGRRAGLNSFFVVVHFVVSILGKVVRDIDGSVCWISHGMVAVFCMGVLVFLMHSLCGGKPPN